MQPPLAILFDLDGTLANSEAAHMQAWNDVLAKKNLHLSHNDFLPFIGVADAVMIAAVAKQYNFLNEADVLLQEKRQRFQTIAAQHVTAIDGVLNGLQKLMHVPKAIVTMSNSNDAAKIISATGLQNFFTTIVTSSHVQQVKPNPECYILGAQKLGLQPHQCYAVEDSIAGLQAAVAAGCVTCGVANSIPINNLQSANYVFNNTNSCLQFLQKQF
jgi:HAD superfamily hydrolase (TIGR01509 family)